MNEHVKDFFRKGFIASGFGPLVYILVIFYIISTTDIVFENNTILSGVLASYILAFIAGASGFIYRIEGLRVLPAAVIQGIILYADYLIVYLVSGWFPMTPLPIMIFSFSFAGAYLAVWAVISAVTKSKVKKLNSKLSA